MPLIIEPKKIFFEKFNFFYLGLIAGYGGYTEAPGRTRLRGIMQLGFRRSLGGAAV